MKKFLFIISIVIIQLGSAQAQEASPQDSSSIATEKVEVIKNYEAIIQQAKEKEVGLNEKTKDPVVINYSYSIDNRAQLDFERPEEVVRPLTYKSDHIDKDVKDGSFYGGYGNFKTLSLGAAYHYYIEDWLEAGFSYDHLSADNTERSYQKFNTNRGKFYASYFLGKKTKAGVEGIFRSSDHYSFNGVPTDSVSPVQLPVEVIG